MYQEDARYLTRPELCLASDRASKVRRNINSGAQMKTLPLIENSMFRVKIASAIHGNCLSLSSKIIKSSDDIVMNVENDNVHGGPRGCVHVVHWLQSEDNMCHAKRHTYVCQKSPNHNRITQQMNWVMRCCRVE